jgi:hypothetical protein
LLQDPRKETLDQGRTTRKVATLGHLCLQCVALVTREVAKKQPWRSCLLTDNRMMIYALSFTMLSTGRQERQE